MTERDGEHTAERPRTIALFGREFRMPQSRRMRVSIGVLLVILGLFGFLPVLGFWMIPLGIVVLSYEFHAIRRLRRRFLVWREKRKRARSPA